MFPAIAQAYLPTWTANVTPVLFGLGAVSAAKYPDGAWLSRAAGCDDWCSISRPQRRISRRRRTRVLSTPDLGVGQVPAVRVAERVS
jgi:hypothetical protein